MEVPRFVKWSTIAPQVVIPKPANKQYISRKSSNGYKDQRFTSADCKENFWGKYIHEDEDPGNQSIHPSYVTVVTRKMWVPYGLSGWKNAWKEMRNISKALIAPKEGIANIREVYNVDVIARKLPSGKFWLADQLVETDAEGTHFSLMYVDDGKIKSSELCLVDKSGVHEKAGNIGVGILAVATLETVIRNSEVKKVRGLWDY